MFARILPLQFSTTSTTPTHPCDTMKLGDCIFKHEPNKGFSVWKLVPFNEPETNRNHWVKGRGDSEITNIVLHYTVFDNKATVEKFTEGIPERVSAHYVIAMGRKTDCIAWNAILSAFEAVTQYLLNALRALAGLPACAGWRDVKAGTVLQIVDDQDTAWHAGRGVFGKVLFRQMNPSSLGIELVNLSSDNEDGTINFVKFDPKQIESLVKLLSYLTVKYSIAPHCVIGHQDCQPIPKSDPGPLFPWRELYYKYNLGAWVELEECPGLEQLEELGLSFTEENFQQALSLFGYRTDMPNESRTKAFQAHFIAQGDPKRVTGQPTLEQYRIICGLVKKYRPETGEGPWQKLSIINAPQQKWSFFV